MSSNCNRVYCTHVSGHDPFIFSFRFLFLFDWVGVLWPQLSKVLKPVRWARSVLFPPSVPAEAGCLFVSAAGVRVFISGESLHCFLVGWCTNKSDVTATSDLWLFIHASNLLPLTTPLLLPLLPYIMLARTMIFFNKRTPWDNEVTRLTQIYNNYNIPGKPLNTVIIAQKHILCQCMLHTIDE